MDLGFTQILPLDSSSGGSRYNSTSGIQGEIEVSRIRSSARGQLPPGQNSRGQAVGLSPFWALPHTKPQSGNTILDTLSMWFTWVALPWLLPKALLHPTYLCTFLQQATLLRQGVKAALPNTQKQTQGSCQNEETKKYGPNERTEQNSRKRTIQNRDKQSMRCRIQNNGD